MYSCSSDNDIYSCDPDADEWAKENKNEIVKMNRSEWKQISLNEEYRMAAFRAFSPDQQQEFWIDKLEEVLELDWNTEERNHIQLLLNYVQKTDIFHNGVSDEFEISTYRWLEYAKETLGWDSSTMYGICATGDKMLDKEGSLESLKSKNSHLLRSGSENWCACSQTSDWCDPLHEIPGWVVSCNSDSCDKTVKGCGTFFQFSCDGICKSPIA